MKDPVLIVCRCGRIKKHGTWIWIVNPLSDFLEKLFEGLASREINPIKDDKIQITILLDKCQHCKEKEAKDEGRDRESVAL